MSDRLSELRRRHANAEAGGGEQRRARQHEEGKLSARERIDLLLDGRHVQTLLVQPSRRVYQIGPIAVMPGDQELVFHPAEEPTVAGDVINNDDRRPLSFALGTWNWTVRGDQP